VILEHALLDVLPGHEAEFQMAFADAPPLIACQPGFDHCGSSAASSSPTAFSCLWSGMRSRITLRASAHHPSTSAGANSSTGSTTRSLASSTTRPFSMTSSIARQLLERRSGEDRRVRSVAVAAQGGGESSADLLQRGVVHGSELLREPTLGDGV
jgi:hypothetical protein